MRRISSAQWQRAVDDQIEKVVRYLVEKSISTEAAELKEAGAPHECGHRWEISIRSSLHSSGTVDQGPKGHRDADYWQQHPPVTIRAHGLRDALIRAAMLPVTAWFSDDEEPKP